MTIGFEPSSYIVNETEVSVQVCVKLLDGTLERAAVVTLFTTDGSATGLFLALSTHPLMISLPLAPDDYIPVSNVQLTFDSSIPENCEDIIIVVDGIVEDVMVFFANLTTDDSSLILDPKYSSITIISSDSKSIVLLKLTIF